MKQATIEQLLKNAGLRVTPARVLLLKILAKATKPISGADVLKTKQGHDLDKVTVYRNLSAMHKAGVLSRIELGTKDTLYELQIKHGHHHHIVCLECSEIESFESCAMKDIVKQIKNQSTKFAQITDHSMELFGKCHQCIKKAA